MLWLNDVVRSGRFVKLLWEQHTAMRMACEYTSAVTRTEEWPSRSDTAVISMPAASRCDPWLWRGLSSDLLKNGILSS
jgi:hypothetical protein